MWLTTQRQTAGATDAAPTHTGDPRTGSQRPVSYSGQSVGTTPSGATIELSESLLELTEKEQTFVLNGDFANKLAADEQPVLSLFDDFSAPVKVERDIRQQDLRY